MLRAGPRRSGRLARWLLRSLSVAAVLLLATLGVAWWYSRPPRPDAFYDAPPDFPPSPGVLLGHEPFTRGLPAGARAWRMLYTTTRDDGSRTVSGGLVLAATTPPPGPRPVIAWAHGTTGVAEGCAPSLLPEPYPFTGIVPALDQVIARGWVIVASDYPGLATEGPHEYLIGQGEARAVLDAVRAAWQLPALSLDRRTVAWGHSQGGHAVLWAGGIAGGYAPEIDVVGVAAMAPATHLTALVEAGRDSPIRTMMSSYAMRAYSAVYPDVHFDEYVRPAARLLARGMAARCLAAPGGYFSLYEARLLRRNIFGRSPGGGPLGARFDANTPRLPVPVPLLIAQGDVDDLVLPDIQDQYVAERCSAGQALDYRAYAGRDHLGLVAADSPLIADLVRWTEERLAGAPAAPGCHTRGR
ncbi:MAG: lipase family protein [Vicinamibacterales bacterium]